MKYLLITFLFFPFLLMSQDKSDTLLLKNTFNRYSKKIPAKKLFNEDMMTVLFENNVGTSFSGSKDLSTQKYFTTLDASDNSIGIGVNFSNRDNKLEKLNWIITGALKIKANNGLSVVFENGEFQENNIGLNLGFTKIGNGIISFHSEPIEKAIKAKRDTLQKVIQYKTNEFNSIKLEQLKKLTQIKFNSKLGTRGELEIKELKKYITKKDEELYQELIDEELKMLKELKEHFHLRNWWINGSVTLPIGITKYNTTNSTDFPLRTNEFYAYEIAGSFNYAWLRNDNKSYFLKARGTIKNNNNILVNNLSTTTFSTFSTGFNNTQIATGNRDGYITDYREFLTASLYLEPTWFFYKNSIGLSPAIELNMGNYNSINWKLGIPISLKDKEDKPILNFELQWREDKTFNGSRHLIGISTSFLFGKLNDI